MCPLLQVVVSYYRICFEGGRWSSNIVRYFIRSCPCLLSLKSHFYSSARINADALIVPGVTQFRANREGGDKGSVSTFGLRQPVGLLTRRWKHGSVHVHILRGTCKMCRARVGLPRPVFLRRHTSAFDFCQFFSSFLCFRACADQHVQLFLIKSRNCALL